MRVYKIIVKFKIVNRNKLLIITNKVTKSNNCKLQWSIIICFGVVIRIMRYYIDFVSIHIYGFS